MLITKVILISITKKRVLFETHFLNGNNSQKSFYVLLCIITEQYLNKLTKIKTISKKLYFEKELHNNRENLKKTWDIIETLLPSKSKSRNNAQNLHDIASDNQAKQAEQFNEFFCTIGEKSSNIFLLSKQIVFRRALQNELLNLCILNLRILLKLLISFPLSI